MEWNFHWIQGIQRIWGITEAWIGLQYKDLLCYLCLCGLVVSSLSVAHKILGSSPTMLIFNFFWFFCYWIQRIQWKHLEKTPMHHSLLRCITPVCNARCPLVTNGVPGHTARQMDFADENTGKDGILWWRWQIFNISSQRHGFCTDF